MEDEIERGVVAPVHILERDEHWLRACEDCHGLRQRVKQPSLVRLGIDRCARTRVGEERPQLGKEPDEFGCSWREDVCDDSWGD